MRQCWACLGLAGFFSLPLFSSPKWKAPDSLPFGELATLELLEEDPSQAPLPRPAEEKLGAITIRSVEPTPDGRGWRFSVQAFQPGRALIPAMDLGDGRRIPELRIQVNRTVRFGESWMGLGGGQEDILPYLPFPWAWASVVLIPLLPLGWWGVRLWAKTSRNRHLSYAKHHFAKAWPPASKQRDVLDHAHGAGRELLALRFGEEARSWGTLDMQTRHLDVWADWVQSLDSARFSRSAPPFPKLQELLKVLEGRR